MYSTAYFETINSDYPCFLAMIDRWRPFSISELLKTLQGYDSSWWLAGGYALDLYLGKTTRNHADIDIILPRNDQLKFKTFLPDWQLYIADGDLVLWKDQPHLMPPKNDLWAMKEDWFRFQVMFLDVQEGHWVFKRNLVKQGPMNDFGMKINGIPVIRPEIQLLFKFYLTTPREKDQFDWNNTYPHLSKQARSWLDQYLKS